MMMKAQIRIAMVDRVATHIIVRSKSTRWDVRADSWADRCWIRATQPLTL